MGGFGKNNKKQISSSNISEASLAGILIKE